MSRRTETVWMPLFIADYLAGTSHLSTEEHGAYLLLIMHAWTNGGALPDDDERLRRITRMDVRAWRRSGPVLRDFFTAADGTLRHQRIDRELDRAKANIEQRAAAGRASAERRNAQRNSNEKATAVEIPLERNDERNGKPPPPPPPKTIPIASASATSTLTMAANEVCARLVGCEISGLYPNDPELMTMLAAGLTVDEIVGAGLLQKCRGKSLAYVLGTAKGRRSDAAAVQHLPPAAASSKWAASDAGIEAKARELGIIPAVGETYAALKQRIFSHLEQGKDGVRCGG